MVEIDQKASIATDKLLRRQLRLDAFERHIAFVLDASVAVYDTFPVEYFDKVNFGNRNLQSCAFGNNAQMCRRGTGMFEHCPHHLSYRAAMNDSAALSDKIPCSDEFFLVLF